MKLEILKHIALIGAIIFAFSCDKDYLETEPTSSTSEKTIFESTENAELAINGLAKLMTKQHLGNQGYNGEGTIKLYYGEIKGNNMVYGLSGWSNTINGNYHDNTSIIHNYYPWYYYYKIITDANKIVESINDAEGPDNEKQYIEAQARTYRAYGYFMLSQIYGDRWVDSNDGSTEAVVLRTGSEQEDDLPLVSLGEVYDQVYQDLDEAISLFQSSEYERDQNSENYKIDQSVAHAVYARAAITKQDYTKAASEAELARADYPLMSIDEYQAGFSNPTSEWIWSSYGASDETLYFYSYHAYIAYNSTSSNVRTYPKRMSKELYDQIPSSDIRSDLFLDPQGMGYNTNTGAAGDELDTYARNLGFELQSNAQIFDHMQFKIKDNDQPGVGHLNHFRVSEMVLIEAEAKYFDDSYSDSDVQDLLEELTVDSGRDPNYTCTASGDDLLDEIKKYRAIELWGEGFDWFDLKRWKDPIDRKTGDEGGNFLNIVAVHIGPDEKNNWKFKIPEKETDHNEEL